MAVIKYMIMATQNRNGSRSFSYLHPKVMYIYPLAMLYITQTQKISGRKRIKCIIHAN